MIFPILLALALGGASAEIAPDLTGWTPSARWIEASSPNFRVVGALSEEECTVLLDDLELLRKLIGRRDAGGHAPVPGASVAPPTDDRPETVVVAFDRHRDFARYSPWPKARGIGGYFHSDGQTSYLVLDVSARAPWRETALHEAVHAELRTSRPNAPLWFQEGIAEIYSTLAIDGSEALVGLPIARHRDVLRRQRWLPLDAVVTATPEAKGYDASLTGELFYAQSWLLAHYLMIEPRRAEGLPQLLDRLATGEEFEEAIQAVYGLTPGRLSMQLRRWVEVSQWQFLRVPTTASGPPVRTSALSRADVLARLGDLLANRETGGDTLARRHFEAALELDPNQRLAIEGIVRLDQLSRRR